MASSPPPPVTRPSVVNLFSNQTKQTMTISTSSTAEVAAAELRAQQDAADALPGGSQRQFPEPTWFQRLALRGVLYTPRDAYFLFTLMASLIYSVSRLLLLELPFHILTLFRYNSRQHVQSWPWLLSLVFIAARTAPKRIRTISQVRFIGLVGRLTLVAGLLFKKNVRVTTDVSFKVHRETLLQPERHSLREVRQRLAKAEAQRNHGASFRTRAWDPSPEYFESLHPEQNPGQGKPRELANLPEEAGPVDNDGMYTLKGEWIEALSTGPKDTRPRSDVVLLYFHGGGHTILSPASHRDLLIRLVTAIGPGARAFSVDYRLAPEHVFPAAIHDAFAAFLYLTQPNHPSLILDEFSAAHELAVDPRNIVIGGDSAGGNLAAAFNLYLRDYIQPAMPQVTMPLTTVLLSPWTDLASSLPSAYLEDFQCYCPGPIGSSAYNRTGFLKFKTLTFASNYLHGDQDTVLNERNAMGDHRRWEWYSHLSQHPLASPLFMANLENLGDTLIQTATFDRLRDDNRLFAHKLGLVNAGKRIRIELFKDMVHVHQAFVFLKLTAVAVESIATFIVQSNNEANVSSSTSSYAKVVAGSNGDNSRLVRKSKEYNNNSVVSRVAGHDDRLMVKVNGDNVEWVVYETDKSIHYKDCQDLPPLADMAETSRKDKAAFQSMIAPPPSSKGAGVGLPAAPIVREP